MADFEDWASQIGLHEHEQACDDDDLGACGLALALLAAGARGLQLRRTATRRSTSPPTSWRW